MHIHRTTRGTLEILRETIELVPSRSPSFPLLHYPCLLTGQKEQPRTNQDRLLNATADQVLYSEVKEQLAI